MPRSTTEISVVFHEKIKKTAKRNSLFRKVIYDGRFSELAVMSLAPHAELGEEAHKNTDEILFVVKGKGDDHFERSDSQDTTARRDLCGAGEDHNLRNVGRKDLKLLCVCSPPSSKISAGIHKSGERALEQQMRYAWEQ